MTYDEAMSAVAEGKLVSIHGLKLGQIDGDDALQLYVNGEPAGTAYSPFPSDMASSAWTLAG